MVSFATRHPYLSFPNYACMFRSTQVCFTPAVWCLYFPHLPFNWTQPLVPNLSLWQACMQADEITEWNCCGQWGGSGVHDSF